LYLTAFSNFKEFNFIVTVHAFVQIKKGSGYEIVSECINVKPKANFFNYFVIGV